VLDMVLLFLHLLILLSLSSTAADPISNICEGDTYAANSPFESNLKLLLASLSLSSTNSTFSNLAKGSTPDRAYGLFLCRGDISLSQCSACVHTAIQDAPQICPKSKQATLWYDTCELRYSDESFFNSFGNNQTEYYPQGPNASNPDLFSKNERALMSNLSYQAAYNSDSLMFAMGEVSVNGSSGQQAIYGLAQCTRDLSADMCSQCLGQLVVFFQCCDSQTEGGILGKSCSFRYGVSKFFEGSPKISVAGLLPPPPSALPLSRPPSSAPTEEDNGKGK